LAALSDEALEEWRAHPVSVLVRQALLASLKEQREAASLAYWAGRPWPEQDRLALLRQESLVEDMFEASADDFKAMMDGSDGKHERVSPG